jgi:hypothetical protein
MVQLDVLRCPFAESGIGQDAMAACPGYEATPLVFNRGIGESIPSSETCAHMGPLPTSRGFMAGCTHPEAPTLIRMAKAAFVQATGAINLSLPAT